MIGIRREEEKFMEIVIKIKWKNNNAQKNHKSANSDSKQIL